MSRFDGLDPVALDRHITGNYGQDQYDDRNYDIEDLIENESEFESCSQPGKHGCGFCDACEDYHDQMLDAYMDREYGI